MNSLRRKSGVKMETVLTPEQCKKMKHFLGLLVMFYHYAKEEGVEKPDVVAFMNTYVDIYSRRVRIRGRQKNRKEYAS